MLSEDAPNNTIFVHNPNNWALSGYVLYFFNFFSFYFLFLLFRILLLYIIFSLLVRRFRELLALAQALALGGCSAVEKTRCSSRNAARHLTRTNAQTRLGPKTTVIHTESISASVRRTTASTASTASNQHLHTSKNCVRERRMFRHRQHTSQTTTKTVYGNRVRTVLYFFLLSHL